MWIWGMLAKHLFGTRDILSPHEVGGLGGQRWCWNSVYLQSWMLWQATLESLIFLQTFQLGLCPLGSKDAWGAEFSRNFLGWCLTSSEETLVINLRYSSEKVKLEVTFFLGQRRRSKSGLGNWQCIRWKPPDCPFFILYAEITLLTYSILCSSCWSLPASDSFM